MKQTTISAYDVKIQAERFFRTTRYHWVVCVANDPDQMVSWGHAASQPEAETAAQNEINDLCSGLTQGGRVTTKNSFSRRTNL